MIYETAFSTSRWYLDSLVMVIGYLFCTDLVPTYVAKGREMGFADLISSF